MGAYKRLPNEVGGNETTAPENVSREMKALLAEYNAKRQKTLADILDLHQRFETIHPFQDGNGRVGRLVMFKECLANGIVPFIITDDLKMFYYRGLQRWSEVREYLTDTCLTAAEQLQGSTRLFQNRVLIPFDISKSILFSQYGFSVSLDSARAYRRLGARLLSAGSEGFSTPPRLRSGAYLDHATL